MKAPAEKPTNLTELASVLGISRTLVSQVVNNHRRVSIKPETRQRVLAAIQEFDIPLQRKASNHVCVVEPCNLSAEDDTRAMHPYFGEKINLGIRRMAADSEHALSFVPMKEGWQAKVCQLAQTQSIAGILMVGRVDLKVIQAAGRCGVPTVLVDCSEVRSQADSIEMDQSEMVRLAVEILAQRGAQKIAFFHPQSGHPNDEFRLLMFPHHMANCGLSFERDLVVPTVGNIHGGQSAMTEFLQSGKPFDAVIGSGDYALAGALLRLQAVGKRVPEDIQLISIGGDPICSTMKPTLAHIDGGAAILGERALGRLLQRIDSQVRHPERVMVHPIFHDGGSLRRKMIHSHEEAHGGRRTSVKNSHKLEKQKL